jgi:DNA modification methylase
MKTEKVNISKIKTNPNNPRLIKDDKFKKLVKSIKEFPEMLEIRPIVVDKDNIVLGGNMRLRACQEAGLKEVHILQADQLTEKQQREFIIKDNVGFGEWDWDDLANEWDVDELEDWGLDLPVDLAVQELEAEEDDYQMPDEIKTDIVLGDLIEIGEHRLLCGDSTDSEQVAKLMNGEKADMVFTDPPYNINYGNIKHPKFKVRDIENDNMSKNDFKSFVQGFVSNIKLFCDGIVYCWSGQGEDGRIMFTVLDENLHHSTTIIWNKDQFTLGRGKYQNKYEPCWFGWVNSGKTFTNDRTLTNVWDYKRPQRSDLHPTMKPIELCENALNHASKKGNKVLDLFLGSGSTMVAAHQLNRKCYGMELDPKYCQVIVDRMIKLDNALEVKINGKPYKKTNNGE